MGLSRRRFLTSTTLLGAATAAGCSSRVGGVPRPDPADLRRVSEAPDVPDRVNVTILAFEPYTVEDGGELSGPVPDVARKVLNDIGVPEVQFTVLREEQLVIAMSAAGQLEMAAGLTIRADLCRDGMRFSRPDYVSGTAFAVPAGNPKGLKTFADVVGTGARIAVWRDLPWEQDAVQAGVPDGNIVRLNGLFELLDAVRGGQADCFAFDDLSLRGLLEDEGNGLEAAPPFMPAGRLPIVGAYLFPEDSPLYEPFNAALEKLHESGDWLEMVEPFGLGEEHEPPDDLTTEKACAG
jgi:polar amino acid transport system substrate-binding protein